MDDRKDEMIKLHSKKQLSHKSTINLQNMMRSNQFKHLYQSSELFKMNPGEFLRKNLSERKELSNREIKISERGGYTKPFSIKLRVNKFEVAPNDIIATDSKPRAARNLLKRKKLISHNSESSRNLRCLT